MCEIAILGPANPVGKLTEYSMELFRSMRSSLGITSVYDTGTHFNYSIFKSTDPTSLEVRKFFYENTDPLIHIIHGRLATHGAVTQENSHPLEIDCDECDIDYVIHNGVVSDFWNLQRNHMETGHYYRSNVDTEAIAHEFGKVPDQIEEITPPMKRFGHQQAYILMNSERIFVHAEGGGYHLTDTPRMARTNRPFGPSRREKNYDIILMTPHA